jgi:hypothetical protein
MLRGWTTVEVEWRSPTHEIRVDLPLVQLELFYCLTCDRDGAIGGKRRIVSLEGQGV